MRAAHSFGVEAVVLRHTDTGEADRVVTLFTRQAGKMHALVKGARKITSRKAGHMQPFTRVRLQLAKRHDMPLVTQADTTEAYAALRENLVLTSQAAYVMELLDRLTYEDGVENSSAFNLLTETLGRLASGVDPWLATRYYEMRLLDDLGFRPKLFECANCGAKIVAEDQYFSFASGGVICAKCGGAVPNLRRITVEALKYLRHFQRSSYAEAGRANPGETIRAETEVLMQGYFTYLLERELKSPGFLRDVRR